MDHSYLRAASFNGIAHNKYDLHWNSTRRKTFFYTRECLFRQSGIGGCYVGSNLAARFRQNLCEVIKVSFSIMYHAPAHNVLGRVALFASASPAFPELQCRRLIRRPFFYARNKQVVPNMVLVNRCETRRIIHYVAVQPSRTRFLRTYSQQKSLLCFVRGNMLSIRRYWHNIRFCSIVLLSQIRPAAEESLTTTFGLIKASKQLVQGGQERVNDCNRSLSQRGDCAAGLDSGLPIVPQSALDKTIHIDDQS